MLIAISRYKKSLDEVEVYRAQHHAFLKPYFIDGSLLVSGRQDTRLGGVIISKNATRAEFERILQEDPFAKSGVAEYHITEFNPFFYDSCLKELFSN